MHLNAPCVYEVDRMIVQATRSRLVIATVSQAGAAMLTMVRHLAVTTTVLTATETTAAAAHLLAAITMAVLALLAVSTMAAARRQRTAAEAPMLAVNVAGMVLDGHAQVESLRC